MIGTRALAVACIVLGPAVTASGQEVSFHKDVYPILEANCAVCHAPHGVGYARSGFSVQTYETVMKGTKYGAVVIPGSSLDSNLVWLLEHQADPSINMPKVCEQMTPEYEKCEMASQSSRHLPRQELIVIMEWVDQGAKDN